MLVWIQDAIRRSEENARLKEAVAEKQRTLRHLQIFLASGKEMDEREGDGPTWLMFAARRGYNDIVTILLNRGADIEVQDMETGTALMHAVDAGKSETVRLLLERGANVNAPNGDGQTALILAYCGPLEVVHMLLEAGANIDFEDNSGATALSIARLAKCCKVVETLKQYGATE